MDNNYGSQKKHIAKTGASSGLWVTCNAKDNCRNGGTHISASTLAAAQKYLSEKGVKKSLPTITEDEILAFQRYSLLPPKNSFEALLGTSSDKTNVAPPAVTPGRKTNTAPPKNVTWETKNTFTLDPAVFHQLGLDAREAGLYLYSPSVERRKSGLGGLFGKEVVILHGLKLEGPYDKVKKVFDRMQWGITSIPAATVYRIEFE